MQNNKNSLLGFVTKFTTCILKKLKEIFQTHYYFVICLLSGVYEIIYAVLAIVEQKQVDIVKDLILLTGLVIMIIFSYFFKEKTNKKMLKESIKLCQLIFYLEYSFQVAQHRNNYCFFCVFQILLMLYNKEIKELHYIVLLYFFIAFYIIVRVLILSNFLVESLYSLISSLALSSIVIRNGLFSQQQEVYRQKKDEENSQLKSFDQVVNLDQDKLQQGPPQNNNISQVLVNNSHIFDIENSLNFNLRKKQSNSMNNSKELVKSKQQFYQNQVENQFAQVILSQIRTGIALIDSKFELVYTNKYLKQQMSTSNQVIMLQNLLDIEIIQKNQSVIQEDCCQVSDTWSKAHLNKNQQEQFLQKQTLNSFKTSINTNSSRNRNSIHQQHQVLESYNSIVEKKLNQIETLNNITEIQSRFATNHNSKKCANETRNKLTLQQLSYLENKSQKKQFSQSEKLIHQKEDRKRFSKQDKCLNKYLKKKYDLQCSNKQNEITFFCCDQQPTKSSSEKKQKNNLKTALKNLHQLLIPPNILQLFQRDQLTLQDIIEYLFECQEKQDKQNCWSSDDLNERKKTNQLQQNQIIEAQQEQSQNIIYLIENNNLVLSFKQKWDQKNFKKIRIGFYASKKGFDANEFFTDGIVMIEVLEDYELSKTIEDHEINQYKNRMLASVSHELRTPLNCSIQLLQSLLTKDQDHLNQSYDGEIKEMIIKPALNSNLLLLNIINDILDYGQINQGQLEIQFQPFSIVDTITECIDLIYFQANQKGLTIEVEFDINIPEIIYSDQSRLKQVLLNLLSNSLKFTDSGTIRVNTVIENFDLIRIEVSDTGCGIPEDNLEKVLQAFGNKSTGKFLNTIGAGFGMSIANNLALGLGGNRSIQIQSRVKEGSTFTFYVINRAKNKKGCQYKLKDVFNMKLVRWETLNRLDVQSTYLKTKKQKTKLPSELNNNKSDIDNPSHSQIDNLDIQTLSHKTNSFLITYRPKNDNLKQIPNRSFSIGHSIKSNQEIKSKTKQNSSTKYTKIRSSFFDCIDQVQHTSNQPNQYQEQLYNQEQYSCPYLYKSEQKLQAVESCMILEDQQTDLAFMFASDQPKNTAKKYFKDIFLLGDETQISLSHRKSFDTINDDTKFSQDQFDSKNSSSIKTLNKKSKQNKVQSINNQKQVQFDKNSQTLSSKLLENTITTNLSSKNMLKQANSVTSVQQEAKKIIKQLNHITPCNCTKILIVDDNDFNLYAIQMSLKSYGLISDKATSGFMAIDKIKQRLKSSECCLSYKLIFMDIDMPIKDGYETTKNILQYFKKKNVPPPKISACSAYVQDVEKKKAFDSGMSYYLTKPINNFELENILKIELLLIK